MAKKTDGSHEDKTQLLASLASEEYCYLTTTGRVSGKPHKIEIWFGIQGNTLYLLAGGGDDSDWVKNLRANQNASVRISKYTFSGTGRKVREAEEEVIARHLLAGKYQDWKEGDPLSDWARTALVVRIDLEGNP